MSNHAFRLVSLLFGLSGSSLAGAYDVFLDNPPLPEILTATRLHQPPAAVPGSISVIDRQLIESSGARELTELLRLVPGMLVVPDGSATNVNYHGGPGASARRLQVLVDGRSVYRPALAQVDWADIPVALEDIERIEVFRGPNTVSYGANALMGVINIITRHPSASLGTRLTYTTGQRGIDDWYARQGFGWEGGALRVSLSGFDHDRFDDLPDSQRLSRFNLRSTHELDSRHSLDWQLAFKDGNHEEYKQDWVNIDSRTSSGNQAILGEQDRQSETLARDYAASLRWNFDLSPSHSLSVQGSAQHWERIQEWRTCSQQIYLSSELRQLYAQSPKYVNDLYSHILGKGPLPVANTPEQKALTPKLWDDIRLTGDAYTCGLINQNSRETRYDLEIQDTLSLSDTLRVVSGASYRHDAVTSETFFNGSRSKDIVRLFGHVEWYAAPQWLLQAGAMYEDDSMIDDSLSPRVALNYLPHPAHGLRAVYAEAVRSPDMFEEAGDWQVFARDLQPTALGQSAAYFFLRSQAAGGLSQERIVARELGYNGHFTELGLHLDVRLFDEEISDLITFRPDIRIPSPTTDDGRQNFRGWEAEGDWRLGWRDRLRFSYAHVESEGTDPYENELTPRHSGSLSWLRDWGHGWSSSLTYLGADSLNQLRFERVDLNIAKRLRLGGTRTTLSGTWQQRLDDNPLGGTYTAYRQRHVAWLSAGMEI